VVEDGQGFSAPFEIPAFNRYCLLNGLDAIGLTLQHEEEIAAFEARRPDFLPVTI
jgi:3-isopropylmalate/(R)-2-methylmalate dehydratase small subunit